MLMRGNFYTWLTWQLNNTVFTRDWVANFSHIIRIALWDLTDSKVSSSNNASCLTTASNRIKSLMLLG